MSRVLTFGALALVALTAGGLYQVKYQVQALEREANALAREVRTTRAAIQVLDAEWSYFNQPDRLEGLNARHLKLGPTKPAQIVRIDALPFRPAPPPGSVPATPPAIALAPPAGTAGAAVASLEAQPQAGAAATAPGRPPIPLAKPAAPPPAAPEVAEAPVRRAQPALVPSSPAPAAPMPGLAPQPRTERTAAAPQRATAPRPVAARPSAQPQGGMVQPVAATNAQSSAAARGAIQQAIDEGLLGGLE